MRTDSRQDKLQRYVTDLLLSLLINPGTFPRESNRVEPERIETKRIVVSVSQFLINRIDRIENHDFSVHQSDILYNIKYKITTLVYIKTEKIETIASPWVYIYSY